MVNAAPLKTHWDCPDQKNTDLFLCVSWSDLEQEIIEQNVHKIWEKQYICFLGSGQGSFTSTKFK